MMTPPKTLTIPIAVVRIELPVIDAAALLQRVPMDMSLAEYVTQLVAAVVSQEVEKGERALKALALADAGAIEIGRGNDVIETQTGESRHPIFFSPRSRSDHR